MTYTSISTTTVTDIPELIADFAEARGWFRSGLVIERPETGRSFLLSAEIGGENNRDHTITVEDTLDPVRRVNTAMPWVNGAFRDPLVAEPTKIHLFGNDDPHTPVSWIACVVECGYNLYRHIYIGNMDKVGDYTGGEIISANMFSRQVRYAGATGEVEFAEGLTPANRYLFSGRFNKQDMPVGSDCGGVNIGHALNSTPFRYFDLPVSVGARDGFTGGEVFGGNADNVNGGYVRRGISDFAGSNILVPPQLYVPESTLVGEDVRFRPIGYPAGVRLLNMESVDPGAAFTVGTDAWYGFPEFSKQEEQATPYGAANPAGFYYPYETSYMLGLAYTSE